MKAMIVPGNGDTPITNNWYPYVKDRLERMSIEVIAENMPDPVTAHKDIWLPFIEQKIGDDPHAILIGHSTGAVASLRYLETHRCELVILVGCCHTDLDDPHEKAGGYFDDPWQWETIKRNAGKIVLFASRDDPYIPIAQPRFIRDQVDAEYHEYKDEEHFGFNKKREFLEIITVVEKMFK